MNDKSVESHRMGCSIESESSEVKGGSTFSGRGFRKTLLQEKLLHGAATKTIHVACQSLLPEGGARVLELLVGPVGVMPKGDPPNVITGVGNWPEELSLNRSLSHRIVADEQRS